MTRSRQSNREEGISADGLHGSSIPIKNMTGCHRRVLSYCGSYSAGVSGPFERESSEEAG